MRLHGLWSCTYFCAALCSSKTEVCLQCFFLPNGSQAPRGTRFLLCHLILCESAVLAAPLLSLDGQISVCSSCGSCSSPAPLAGQDQMGYQPCSRHRGQDSPQPTHQATGHISLEAPPQPQWTLLSLALPLCLGICSCTESPAPCCRPHLDPDRGTYELSPPRAC